MAYLLRAGLLGSSTINSALRASSCIAYLGKKGSELTEQSMFQFFAKKQNVPLQPVALAFRGSMWTRRPRVRGARQTSQGWPQIVITSVR